MMAIATRPAGRGSHVIGTRRRPSLDRRGHRRRLDHQCVLTVRHRGSHPPMDQGSELVAVSYQHDEGAGRVAARHARRIQGAPPALHQRQQVLVVETLDVNAPLG